MDMQAEYIELVEKARRGDKQSLNQLAALARERLRVYVYRLTLKEDLTQEIVQESLLEMCRVLGKLKQTDRFWSWLYGIATNKLHRHHRTEKALKKAAASEERRRGPMRERQGGLENLVSQELRQIVSGAMQKLRTRHKAVLVMRCYDCMSYAEIADSMGCSEFSTRMLFVRAKKALQKELSRNGFGKGSLLAALVVFGKMTAPSEAAAAQLTVPVAMTKVGILAGVAGLATTKTAIVTVTAVGALAVGTATTTSYLSNKANPPAALVDTGSRIAAPLGAPDAAHEKFWYYFPEGPDGPVMLRAELTGTADGSSQQRLQDNEANYCYKNDSVSINNHRMWLSDLSVMRLPTDSRTLASFLSRADGQPSSSQPVTARGRELLVILERQEEDGQVRTSRPVTVRHSNVLEEDYFQSDWSAGATMTDNRDAMHTRGWTYMRIRGQLNGQNVVGTGRIPFVYAASSQHSPWLRLTVADGVTLVDGPAGAIVLDPNGSARSRYPQGSFLQGMNRPWMGLHVMDTVRRDAAEQRVSFKTEMMDDGRNVRVTVTDGANQLVYTIDLDADLIRKIECLKAGKSTGHLEFEYLQDLDTDLSEFEAPASSNERTSLKQSQGLLWLVQLANGAFGN
jgi:RNA polymerase sigma-70 factor (ECF subfamily)